MRIECDCGKFKAELEHFPANSPGRLVCYCDDCQTYLERLQREDLLDPYGGTQVIPVYPNDFKIQRGQEYLQCNILEQKGLHRWSTTCCNSPVANTKAKFPWVGIPYQAYTNVQPEILEILGPIRSRILGKFKRSEPPFKISDSLTFKDILVVLPFVIKGFWLKKFNQSPFFKEDQTTPIQPAQILGIKSQTLNHPLHKRE